MSEQQETSPQVSYNDGSGTYANPGGYMRQLTRMFSFNRGSQKTPNYVKKISDIGIDFKAISKKKAISKSKSDLSDNEHAFGGDSIADDSVPYFQQKYEQRIEFLNALASHPEVEFILHQICDEMIVYDNKGYFCSIDVNDIKLKDEVLKSINKTFNKIYSMYGFGDGVTAWGIALQWLVEGDKFYEIVFDDADDPKNIIGFEEIQANTMIPFYRDEIIEQNGKKITRKIKMWKQIIDDGAGLEERMFSDNQIVHIQWNKIPGQRGRLSYTERLIRSFNLMRTIENCTVAWWIMNSQFRMKIVVPVGNKTTAKAKQALGTVTSKYKEDLLIDHNSGEVTVNGQAKINYSRNIVMPSRSGESPEIDGIKYEGADLSDMTGVMYFTKKLQRDSGLPYQRFNREEGSGTTIMVGVEGLPNDELAFYKSISRYRREYSKLILKPVYIQTLMDYPELKIDKEFKTKLCLNFNSDNLVEETKREELESKALENISTREGLTQIDGETPLYSRKFLYVKKYKIMTEEEWDMNEKEVDAEMKKAEERKKIRENEEQ